MQKILIITLVLTTCAFGCKNMGSKYCITFNNHSTKSVMIMEGIKDSRMNGYPDTLLPAQKPGLTEVTPHNQVKIIPSNKWATIIENLPSGMLSIYVFDTDTVRANNWSEVVTKYKILKRYDLSIQDLVKAGWTVNYQ